MSDHPRLDKFEHFSLAAMSDNQAIIPFDVKNAFECYVAVEGRHPDNPSLWPEHAKKLTDAAIAKLLADKPDKRVLEDAGRCLDSSHPRFPDALPSRCDHVLVRGSSCG